ncbi:MAG: transposase [Proteobacteria bacterium]|nr:transposase [Pseudomonadota bacterium]MBU2462017.1 transposase [bacterium]
MPGTFKGLTNVQWEVLKPLLPSEPEKRGKGMPHADWRKIINAIMWVLITGSRWCDVPRGDIWGSRPGAHRWLGKWMRDGTWERIKEYLLGAAELAGKINWERASVDGSFSPWKGRRGGSRVWVQGERNYHS